MKTAKFTTRSMILEDGTRYRVRYSLLDADALEIIARTDSGK